MPTNTKRISVRAVTLTFMFLLSPLAAAYDIENQGESAYFYGQFCAPCWHGTIPSGEARGCPGNVRGCRNNTWIYKYMGERVYRQNERNIHCYVTANKPVTAHGRVVFKASEIFVYDDAGTLIDRSGYNYWYEGNFGILTSGCPGTPP